MTTPSPQARTVGGLPGPESGDGERIVITGMSGLYPDSHHVKDLADILYNKRNPIASEGARWKFNHPEVCNLTGKVPQLNRFDAQFFKVHYRLADNMDAMGRTILEQTYQTIYDAGVNPEHLSGKKVGVYVGSCFSETEKCSFYTTSSRTGLSLMGCSKTMLANRISYWLNAKGPSMAIDNACCSSLAALEQAYLAIDRGECEAAIVGGVNLCLHPQSSVHYARIMKMCMDGKTKSFDQNADGIAKSEAINVLFLQKAKDAKRIYAEVIHVKTEFTELLDGETGPKYGFYRNPRTMAGFMQAFYKEAGVPPHTVEYVEAFGSAVPEADKSELEAIEEVFCRDRKDPLLVGSVMSNIGYGEAASGISAITKVLLGYHNGELAANLHCDNPRTDVKALRDGRMQIVTDHERFRRTFAAVNGISVTGVNAHVLLHGHYKPKDPNRYKCAIPRLVTLSGRQDSAVAKVLEDLKSRPIDPEELALFHNIHQSRISGHLGRGYIILDTNSEQETVSLSEAVSYFDNARRPLWFVYSGMGSQWTGMGTQLMRIPIFAAAIERCRKVLEPKGVDIVHIITSLDESLFDNILNSFVGIAAIQIGLTDILTAIGIVPDKIIGHSVGELGCAYADGCFTAEEMILSAYSRGLVSVQTPFIKGSMAAVGVGYQEVVKLIPPEIEVACHNGPESSTISGPADVMKQFVAKLTAQGIFAKEVPCSNIAFHSRHIAKAGPGLLKYLKEVIKNPKPRSERWLSTSVPEERWNEECAKYSSADYHTNNLLSSVLFEETSVHIPPNAVLIEIAPHGLLQAILKRSLPESCRNIPMTRRGHQDNAVMVLDAVGKLYMEGYNLKIQAIYPEVTFPVSTGTPMLSHLIEWAHREKWNLPLYVTADRRMAASCNFLVSVHDEEHQFLNGHVIRGKTLYPFSAALVAAWDTLSMLVQMPRKQHSVTFSDLHFYAQPALHDARNLRLKVALHRGKRSFEIMDEDRKVMTGYVHSELDENSKRALGLPAHNEEDMEFDANAVYQTLYERDYFYSGDFRSINKINMSLNQAEIVWNNNWVTFLDGILQLHTLRQKHDTVSQPWHIKQISINVKQHFNNKITTAGDKTVMVADVMKTYGMTRCGGVIMESLQFHNLPKVEEDTVVLKGLKFIPRFEFTTDVSSALQVFLQMVSENISKDVINVIGIEKGKNDLAVFDCIQNMTLDLPDVTVKYQQIRLDQLPSFRDQFLTNVDLVLVRNLSSDDNLCQMLYRVIRRDTYIINAYDKIEERIRPSALYKIVSTSKANPTNLELIHWRPTRSNSASTVVTVRAKSDLSLLSATRAELSRTQKHKLVILTTYPAIPGLKNIVKGWKKEADRNEISLVMISDKDNLDELPDLDMTFNVLNNSIWGGEYYTTLHDKVTIDRGVALRMSKIGDLDSLCWEESVGPEESGLPVTVHYAAINDLDVKRATGVIEFKQDGFNETSFGMDFSGVTDNGQRVMGIVPWGSVSGRVRVRPELVWPVPDHWSLEEAATVPSAYAHALYCLVIKMRLCHGQSILVHGGAGALGQAVIAISLAYDFDVFATVSDVRKKKFLMKLFPQLQGDHIGNSRDGTFGDMVKLATKGVGCNVVICCVKGELKNISCNICSYSSILLDTNLIQSQEKYSFGMYNMSKDMAYIPIDFLSLFDDKNAEELKKIQRLVSEGISRGYIRPLTHMVFTPSEAARAFRLLATSRHRGRAIIRLTNMLDAAQPRISCSPDLCHLVLGDQDALALQLADRLICRGAKKMRLHFTNPPSNLRFKIHTWKKLGVTAKVSSEDLSSNEGIISLLSDSNGLGPVEGIYVVVSEVPEGEVDKLNSIIANLDLAARKICPSVRYFSVVGVGAAVIGQQTCLSRKKNGLTATALQISALQNAGAMSSACGLSWRGAVDAVERSLRSTLPTLHAHARLVAAQTLLQQIARIADIEIPEATAPDVTLSDLGIETANLPHIYSYLKDTHNIALNEESLQMLSIEQIRELDVIAYGSDYKRVDGLSAFFSFVDPDELLATTDMVFLPTLTSNATNRGDEFDVSQAHLIIIPGLEGHYDRFRVLCERLKLPALVLQPGLDFLHESPRDTAQRYVQTLLKKGVIKKNYYLMGYESGALVALEMAAILETLGLIGTVFCVGGTPDEFKSYLEDELRHYKTDEELQYAVAQHMFGLMVGDTDALEKALNNDKPWKEKIDICVSMLLGRVAHSSQYARTLIESAYTRIEQARRYKCQIRSLGSKVVLLRAASLTKDEANCPGNITSMLQKYSCQTVVVEELRAPLAHAVHDLRCPSIINKHLDSEILTAFENRNLCETYLMNADTFMRISAEAEP